MNLLSRQDQERTLREGRIDTVLAVGRSRRPAGGPMIPAQRPGRAATLASALLVAGSLATAEPASADPPHLRPIQDWDFQHEFDHATFEHRVPAGVRPSDLSPCDGEEADLRAALGPGARADEVLSAWVADGCARPPAWYDAVPTEFRRYAEGIHSLDTSPADALARWSELLRLPPDQRRWRATWAAYGTGTVRQTSGDPSGAVDAFREVRALAASGSEDTLGLAMESLREEATVLDQLGRPDEALERRLDYVAAGGSEEQEDGMWVPKIHLEPDLGPLVANDPALDRAAADVELRRLVDSWMLDPSRGATRSDFAKWSRHRVEHPLDPDDAERLALFAFERGWYDEARGLLTAVGPDQLDWVAGRLAFHDGDLDTAIERFRRAGQDHDRAVALEAAGRHAEAMDAYFASRDPLDSYPQLLWLAEHTLPTGPLIAFVERLAQRGRGEDFLYRGTLGRRLVREGRWDEAVRYFDDPGEKAAVRQLQGAMTRARDRTVSPTARSDAAWEAAQLLQRWGQSLWATDSEPDCGGYRTNCAAGYVAEPAERFEAVGANLLLETSSELEPESPLLAQRLCLAERELARPDGQTGRPLDAARMAQVRRLLVARASTTLQGRLAHSGTVPHDLEDCLCPEKTHPELLVHADPPHAGGLRVAVVAGLIATVGLIGRWVRSRIRRRP